MFRVCGVGISVRESILARGNQCWCVGVPLGMSGAPSWLVGIPIDKPILTESDT